MSTLGREGLNRSVKLGMAGSPDSLSVLKMSVPPSEA